MNSAQPGNEQLVQPPWEFYSGNLALDFANTIDWPQSDQQKELLKTPDDLLSWAGFYTDLSPEDLRWLKSETVRDSSLAEATLAKVITVRDAVYNIFTAEAHGQKPVPEDLAILVKFWGEAVRAGKLLQREEVYEWRWEKDELNLERAFYPVYGAAVDLLSSEQLAQVGQCADDRGCGLLFIDTSRNHSRQWCSMEDCGNRAKAQRYYQRRKLQG